MTLVVFSDLDDTLFWAPRKCLNLSNHKAAVELTGGEIGAYSTPQQQALISLFDDSFFIPVTGRRTESLSRVLINFESYKIASHGAIILDSKNNLCPEWQLVLDEEAPKWRERMYRLKNKLECYVEHYNLKLRVREINDYGYVCYLCVKGEASHLKQLLSRHNKKSSEGFIIHLNDRNLAFMPPYASKYRSVSFLKKVFKNQTEGDITFFGLGDSFSDAGFMSICDFQIMPSNSQLAESIT